jgi:hypothetical protein
VCISGAAPPLLDCFFVQYFFYRPLVFITQGKNINLFPLENFIGNLVKEVNGKNEKYFRQTTSGSICTIFQTPDATSGPLGLYGR